MKPVEALKPTIPLRGISSRLTWRVQNIPPGFTETRLRACFHSDDKQYIEIKSLAPDVGSYDDGGSLTATMLFTHPEPGKEPRADHDDLEIDKDFIGFTPLNTPEKDVCADIIAVTGLAGHAFGSWAHNSQKMWLRDYLPEDIQNRARVLIYGYESQLHGVNTAVSIISDFGNSFIQSLMDLRDHPSCRDRPLILIGHSLGALILKQVITDLHPNIRSRLPVRTVLFLGAPHNGLEVRALEALVKGHPTQTLISELKRESPTLIGLAERFRQVAKDFTIHTYYESRPTMTVAQGADGAWERSGEPLMMVERSSALLNMEPEKTRLKVDGDHKQIARLRRGQGGIYPNVLRIIKNALQSAPEQFAATPQAIQPGPKSTSRNGPEWRYSACSICFEEIPEYQKHYFCDRCGDGSFTVCQDCKRCDLSCLPGHDLVERRLKIPDALGGNGEDDEDYRDKSHTFCVACGNRIWKGRFFLSCEEEDLILCLSCRKAGKTCSCLDRHKMLQCIN